MAVINLLYKRSVQCFLMTCACMCNRLNFSPAHNKIDLIGVSVISGFFLWGVVIGPMPNPHPGGPEAILCQVSFTWPIQHGQTYQGPASRAAYLLGSLRHSLTSSTLTQGDNAQGGAIWKVSYIIIYCITITIFMLRATQHKKGT